MDLIDRQAAIHDLCKIRCGCEPGECGLTLEEDGAEECADVRWLLSLPSAEPSSSSGRSSFANGSTNDGDTISRQAAIDEIGEKADEIYKTKQNGATYPHDDFFQGMAYAEDVVRQLPSAEPEKPFVIKINRFLKKDERERVEKELYRKLSQEKVAVLGPEMELLYPNRIRAKWVRNIHDKVICNQCGMFGNNEWNFCPNCGADMMGDG